MESGSKDVIMKHTGVHINTIEKVSTKFTKVRTLGKGAFGKIQLATYKDNKKQNVALKKIKKHKLTPKDAAAQRREVQAAVTLKHPNIVRIFEIYENQRKIVLVMEYSDLGDLLQYLNEVGADELVCREYFRQILFAVYFCHSHRICHRDLKLENVLIFNHSVAKVTDFGFANVFDKGQLLSTFCGSIYYASPEIVQSTPYRGPEVDCWALGVLLYSMLFMTMPFPGPNNQEFKDQIRFGHYVQPKPTAYVEAYTIESVMPFIAEILTVDPENRPSIEQICEHKWVNIGYKEKCLEVAKTTAAQCPPPVFDSLPEPMENIKPSEAKEPKRSQIPHEQQTPTVERPTLLWNMCGRCMKPSDSVTVELHELSLAPKTDENPMDIQTASTSTAKRHKPSDESV